MLSLLRISDYAIIDELELELHPGFSVMTGETGAGKSILVDAVGLALGDRADSGVVRTGARRAEISLLFELAPDHPARHWLKLRDLDDDGLCCLRRSVGADGRSRAFVNNQPVTLKDLREVGGMLVDIHGQHAHQSLLTAPAQRELVDANAGNAALCGSVAEAFSDWQQAERDLAQRSLDSAEREARLDLLRFQLGEIEALGLGPDEAVSLRRESERLRHIDELQQAMGGAADALYESESASAHGLANRARRLIETAVRHDPDLKELLQRLQSTEIEIREIGQDLSHRLDALDADPARIEEVEARLNRLQQIARRHRVADDEVFALGNELKREIESLDSSANSLAALESRRQASSERYRKLARSLSQARRETAARLAASVTDRLHELGLPAAEFRIAVTDKPDARADSTGMDRIEFEVSTNPGLAPGPIERVASGGELSRIGLALAVVATDPSSIPTLVFDEVDAGVGGAVAEVVGRRLREIAGRHQVLCVTHLPQVASQGTHHYSIVKIANGGTSTTRIDQLTGEQRVDELSRMLGGMKITATTRAHAAEMIRLADGA